MPLRPAKDTDFVPLTPQQQTILAALMAAYEGDPSCAASFLDEHWEVIAGGAIDCISQARLVADVLRHDRSLDGEQVAAALEAMKGAQQHLMDALAGRYSHQSIRARVREHDDRP